MVNAPSLIGRYQHLRDEWPGATGTASTPVADAPEPDAQIIVADHDAGVHEARAVAQVRERSANCRAQSHFA
jgi:hypothetical protein